MDKINRLCSPMHPLEENLDDTDAIRQKKIEFIKSRELTKSPYSIGSINDIETKVLKLERQINGFKTHLSDDSDSEFENKPEAPFKSNFKNSKAVAFNKPQRIKRIVKKSIKVPKKSKNLSEDKAVPKFIELCQHPGFNSNEITELPGFVHVDLILRRVYAAQPSNFMNKYNKFFDTWFFCPSIHRLLKDMFWYFFISKYGSEFDKNDLRNYFSQAATNYVEFLYRISMESQYYQEKLKKILPDLLSQALYACLSECFPDSWIQFNDEFIESVIQLVYFWLSGIRPMKGVWYNWNMQELKPTEQKLKEKIIEEQSRLGYKNVQVERKKHISDISKPNTSLKTTQVGILNHSHNVLFNLHGYSPLIQHYMNKYNVDINVGTNNLVKHKEILPIINDSKYETYADVVERSLNDIKKRGEVYKKSHEQNTLETKKFLRLQKINNIDNKKRHEKLLSNKSKMHILSNLMMHEYLKDKDSISFGADKAVTEAILAIE